MGFFGKLFEKKECAICGGEIGLLGNRKLEDGNCCKDCAKKLSPWFDERRHSTVEQIKAQLQAREYNKLALETWQPSIALGDYYTMYVKTKGDVPISFVVSNSDKYRENNADILSFLWITACTPDIRESRTELKQTNSQGEKVSYDPPRYEYRYDFYIKLDIKGCDYIDDMRFRINSSTVKLETVMPKATLFSAAQSFDPMLYPEYRKYKAMLDEICEVVSCGQRGVPLGQANAKTDDSVEGLLDQIRNASTIDAMTNASFRLTMLTMEHPDKAGIQAQIAQAMTQAKNRLSAEAVGAAAPMTQVQAGAGAPVATWICDLCGKENTGMYCEGCASPRPAPKPAPRSAGLSWLCVCGARNTGRFCNECGTKQFTVNDIECSECSWRAEPGDIFTGICPSCDHKFGPEDLDI